jgi:16S rRNA (uracil1498-N3)-methyltransferase
VTLDGPEAHHLRDVVRAAVGDRVLLFDGGGSEYLASVVSVKRSGVQLQVLEWIDVDREAARRVTLGVALPKGERQRWLVEKAVELGVARITPLETTRGVAVATDGALDRLRRAVIEASKQCGRNRLMEIAPPLAFADFLAAAPPTAERWFGHPGAPPAQRAIESAGEELWGAIGPEGGFTDDECAVALAAGWTPVSFGPRILRVETAALAIAALACEVNGRNRK